MATQGGEEPMSDLQRELQRRRNTLNKTTPKPGPSASGSRETSTAGRGAPAGGGNSLLDELQKRNKQSRNSCGGPTEQNVAGGHQVRNVGGPRNNFAANRHGGEDAAPRKKAAAQPPPMVTKRGPRTGIDQNGSPDIAGGGSSTQKAPIAHGHTQNKPSSAGGSRSSTAGVALQEEPVGKPELPGAEEPMYVNIAQIRKEVSALNGVKEEEEKRPDGHDNKPSPGGAEVPRPPRRTKSFRPPDVKSAEVNTRTTGTHSGYNSGASGDGVVRHKRRATVASNNGASGVNEVTPMGSSSESDYSGDGKVRRMRQRERVRRGSNASVPPLPQHPPPTDQPPQLPQHPPPHTDPPQLPPPRQNRQPVDYEQSAPPIIRPNLDRKKSLLKRPPSSASAAKLLDYLCSHAHQLPAKVLVREGIPGNQTVSTGSTLNLHFLRNVSVATLCDPDDNEITYMLPCNSAIQLGLIYTPSPYDESASPYMTLRTVADIMKLKLQPLIVTATTSYDGGSPEKSVAKGEVLFIKGAAKGGTLARGKQFNMVNAIGEEKHLPAKCSGFFSTDPRHTKVCLSVLLQQNIQWPQFVILYPTDREVLEILPESMSNALVELQGVSGETSVIATPDEGGSMGTGGGALLDVSINAALKVSHQDMRQPDKHALTRATTQLYERFKASESQYIFEKQKPAKSVNLQTLFYRKILEEEKAGVHLYLPSKDGPPPAVFDLKGKKTRKKSSSAAEPGEDSVSISSSVSSVHDEQDSRFGVKPAADTLSISSNMSGNVSIGGMIPHSASGMDLCGNDSNAEVDVDEEQAIYEDIEEICENLKKEVGEEEGGGGGGRAEGSEEQAKEAGKKSSILNFLKKKTKGKKGKEKESSDAYVDVEFGGEGAPSQQSSDAKESAAVPEPIPTHSRSSSESYDEMKPSNVGYLSDNYEECAFGNEPPPFPGAPTAAAPELPSKKRPSLKPSLLAKAIGDLNEPGAPALGESMDDLEIFKKKRGKLKESMKKGGTLPRKMKLGSGDKKAPPISEVTDFHKKAPPISEVTDFPPDARVADISMNEQVWSLTNQVERLKAEVKELRSAVEALMAAQGPTETNVEANLKALKEMTLEQVLMLLDSMDMSQYRQSFRREQVTGVVLALVDDDILKTDLSVSSKLHRTRLLRIASGEVSVVGGKDSKYVQFSR